jgi:hypothetical protein
MIPPPTTADPDAPVAAPEAMWDPRWCAQCGDPKSRHEGATHEWRPASDTTIRRINGAPERIAAERAALAKAEPVSLARFLAEKMDPPSWLVGDLIPKGPAVGALVGAEKNGKSLFGLQLCFAVALGHKVVGLPVENAGATVFIEYEGSRAALQRRAATMAAQTGALSPSQPVALTLIHRPKAKIDTDEGEAWLLAQCEGKALCVIGPVSKACAMDKENDAKEWQRLADRLQRIVDATGCTLLLIHHTRKPDRQMGPPSRVSEFFASARGSNAYMGAVDIALGVLRDPESSEGVLFFLERDGASGRLPYDFDVKSLHIWPSTRKLGKATVADKVAPWRDWIAAHPGCTRKDLMTAFGVSEETVDRYIATLGEEVIFGTGAHGARTFSISSDQSREEGEGGSPIGGTPPPPATSGAMTPPLAIHRLDGHGRNAVSLTTGRGSVVVCRCRSSAWPVRPKRGEATK